MMVNIRYFGTFFGHLTMPYTLYFNVRRASPFVCTAYLDETTMFPIDGYLDRMPICFGLWTWF